MLGVKPVIESIESKIGKNKTPLERHEIEEKMMSNKLCTAWLIKTLMELKLLIPLKLIELPSKQNPIVWKPKGKSKPEITLEQPMTDDLILPSYDYKEFRKRLPKGVKLLRGNPKQFISNTK
jgi:hypothetical protein